MDSVLNYLFLFILQLEEGQVKMQSRLEEEEEEKAALLSRIQRLTKLILVSSKNSTPGYLGDVASQQRSLSASEDDVCFSLSYYHVLFFSIPIFLC